MKAIVQGSYGSADVLELRDIDIPVVGDHDVLVRVHAAGVDIGVWHVMAGKPYLLRVIGFGLRKPKVPLRGRDVAGVVEAMGKNVTRFQPGDEVFGTADGSFAEYASAPEARLARKPANLTFEQAAAVPISGGTALQGLRKGDIQSGQEVLIVGASGGVGSFAVQLAKTFGAKVTGVSSTAKMDFVRSLGADDVIDYTHEDFADGTRQWDLVLDTGGRRSLSDLRRALTPKGTLVIVGGEGGGNVLGGFDRNIRSGLASKFVSQRLTMLTSKERGEDFEALRELIEAGKVTPVIDRIYPLNEAPEAIRYLQEGHARGKIVLTV
ncbi:MAG: NAD(P)-dependent alcohol dehydrogenase [Actinobacteria bacterium]|nr:MAG: NAD(P)-dependent alcohol dehydrogenase [Actinomycetota bacterium]TMK94668.1 MAG: NAD(P)-dependent alcohol dehydrogenase [Actinomycetota bacterium]TMM24642.1 MAG: NAD(P)-dependent alcohol dehydrogenase [Actinomycetota bacterium]